VVKWGFWFVRLFSKLWGCVWCLQVIMKSGLAEASLIYFVNDTSLVGVDVDYV